MPFGCWYPSGRSIPQSLLEPQMQMREKNADQYWLCPQCERTFGLTAFEVVGPSVKGTGCKVLDWSPDKSSGIEFREAYLRTHMCLKCTERIKTVQIRRESLESIVQELCQLRRFRDAVIAAATDHIPESLHHPVDPPFVSQTQGARRFAG